MNRPVRLILIVVLGLSSALFGLWFRANYERHMADRPTVVDSELASTESRPTPPADEATPTETWEHHLGAIGTALFISLLGFGGLLAHEVTDMIGARAGRAYFDETQQGPADPDYEKAEEAWTRGDFLEAIQLMREYLAANPRRQHAALRIAEIYEKDLHNPLAAALEYEEVLKQKLPPARWGWAAIHLCNIYTGRLDQLDKAIALLRRIETEFSETAAAKKATARLDQLEAEGLMEPRPKPTEPEEDSEPPPESGSKLPPGFGPRNS